MQTNYLVIEIDLATATPARQLIDGTLNVGIRAVTVLSVPTGYADGDFALRFGANNPLIPVPGNGEFEFDCGHADGVYYEVPAVTSGVARLIIWLANVASFRSA